MITSYEQMPVGVYERIMAALEDSGASDNDKQLELLSALTGLSVDALLDEPLGDFAQQNEAAAFVLVYPQPHAVREAYTLRGVRYLPTLKREKMTAGQFIDWNEIAGQKDGGRRWAQLLSVVLVPEGKTYGSGYDIGEVQEAIAAELCVLDAVALRAFFFDLVRGIIDGYPTLFGTDDEQDGEQEGTEADAEADAEGGSGFADKWGWISCIDAVSGTARCSWDAATDMPVVAFCNILAYRNDKIAEEERQHREWLRKH